MHHRTISATWLLSTWIALALPQSAIAGLAADSEPKYVKQVQEALLNLDIPLDEQEKASVSNRILELCRTRRYAYGEEDILGFVRNVRSSVSTLNWGGLPTPNTPAQSELRELRIRENLLHLETGMDFYERSQSLRAASQPKQASLSDAFWKRVETLTSEHFTPVPAPDRQQKLGALRIAWQEVENNYFTPAGKKPLTEAEADQLLNELAEQAKTLEAQLRDHLGRVPEDVQAGLKEFYLDELLSSLRGMCQRRTALALPVEMDESLRPAMEAMTKQFQEIHSRKTLLLDAQHRQIMDRLAKDDAQYKVDRMMVDIGVGSTQEVLDRSVRSLVAQASPVANAADKTLPAANAADKTLPVAASTAGDSRPALLSSQTASSEHDPNAARQWAAVIVGAIVCLLVAAVVLSRYRRSKILRLLLVCMAGNCLLAGEPANETTRELLSIADEAGLSGQTAKEWSDLISASSNVDRGQTDGYRMIRPALLQDLRRVSKGQMPPPIQTVYLSFVRDVAVESMLHPTSASIIERWPDTFNDFCLSLYPSGLPPGMTESMWRESAAIVIRDEVQADRYRGFYGAIWNDKTAGNIAREWRTYCEKSMGELILGRSYGRRISGNPRLGEDREFTEALVRRLFVMSRASLRDTVMSPQTREAYRHAHLASAEGDATSDDVRGGAP